MMKCKIIITTVWLICLTLLPRFIYANGNQEQTQPQDENNPAISWEFLCKDMTGNIKVLPYNEIFAITSGNQFRVHFKTGRVLYVYIFLYSTDENITLLFPAELQLFGISTSPGTNYSIPVQNDRWLSLEQHTQIKNLYFIAALNRQKKLENLTRQFLVSFNTKNLTTGRKETVKNNLLAEIIRITRSNNRYIMYAEKPNTFSGDVQDDEKQKKPEWIPEENDEK